MISLWQALKNWKMAKPNHFCWADIWTFWYFDVSVWSDEKKVGLSGQYQNSVKAPYCQDWEARYPPKHIRAPPMSRNTPQIPPDTHQTSPRHPPDISREHEKLTDDNRRQQTPPDTLKQHLSVSWGVWSCLFVSVGVCCCLLAPCVLWRSLGGVWGVLWRACGGI